MHFSLHILEAPDNAILQDAGKITAVFSKTFAESEFEKYRVIQDKLFQSDFDRFNGDNLLPPDIEVSEIRSIIETSRSNAVRSVDFCRIQMYWQIGRRIVEENPTIGILLCTAKNDTLVRMTLPSDNNTIVASKYQLYLPSEQQLIAEVERVKKEWEETR